MQGINMVIIGGNLTKDIELRYLTNGKAVANILLASNRKYKSGEETKEEVYFGKAVVFGSTAENCAKYLKKGSPVLITGRLTRREWEKDGVKNHATEIIADKVQFLGSNGAPKAEAPQDERSEWLDEGEGK